MDSQNLRSLHNYSNLVSHVIGEEGAETVAVAGTLRHRGVLHLEEKLRVREAEVVDEHLDVNVRARKLLAVVRVGYDILAHEL